MSPSSQLRATTSESLAAESPPVYHRGDPLDIPLIDNHLVIQLLFPRIAAAIRWVLPKVYLDWTAGQSRNNIIIMGGSPDYRGSHDLTSIENPFLWKRIVEIILHASLLLGSSRLVQQRGKDGCFTSNFWIRTPAMKTFGLFLIPTKSSKNSFNRPIHQVGKNVLSSRMNALRSRILMHIKLVMLVAVTVIWPRLHEEMKHLRQQQIRDRERRQRSRDMELVPNTDPQQQSIFFLSRKARERAIIDQRAKARKSRIQASLIDAILGTAEVFIPPLRLINYLSYLWGMSSTPDLGMRCLGLYYSPCADSNSSLTDFVENSSRHANFHYGNRRLLVEEALRAASAGIPRRGNGTAAFAHSVRQTQIRNDHIDGSDISAQVDGSASVQRNSARTGRWLRKRALSVVGVIEEKNDANAENERFSYNLSCSRCGTENPTISYITSCGHYYCYICLRMAVTDDLYFRCVDCGKAIVSSHRTSFT